MRIIFRRLWTGVIGASWSLTLYAAAVQTAPVASMTQNPARVLAYGLLTSLLVIVLLGGGFLILNIGLLSRRPEDRLGGRSPSDVGLFKDNTWPDEAEHLPAEVASDESSEEEIRRDREAS